MATAEDVNLADTWLNGPPGSLGAKDQLSDAFSVVTNHHKHQNTNTTGSSPPKPNPISASQVDSYIPSQEEQLSEVVSNLFVAPESKLSIAQPRSDRSGVCTNTFFNYDPMFDKKSHDADKESLKIPIQQNTRENGLHWYPHLQEQMEN